MEPVLAGLAESLACEFGSLRTATVAGVLNDCADEFPNGGPHFIEQAARARLLLLGRPQRGGSTIPGEDSLDVSLHDAELADEVHLTVQLMVAANDTDARLSQDEVDRILDVRPIALVRSFPTQHRR